MNIAITVSKNVVAGFLLYNFVNDRLPINGEWRWFSIFVFHILFCYLFRCVALIFSRYFLLALCCLVFSFIYFLYCVIWFMYVFLFDIVSLWCCIGCGWCCEIFSYLVNFNLWLFILRCMALSLLCFLCFVWLQYVTFYVGIYGWEGRDGRWWIGICDVNYIIIMYAVCGVCMYLFCDWFGNSLFWSGWYGESDFRTKW